MITYPHGCAEQIVSTAFPQISLNTLLDLTPKQKMDIETNVKAVISRLSLYQTADGGFAYWPGSPYVSEWVSTYVAHFLIFRSYTTFTKRFELSPIVCQQLPDKRLLR